MNKETPKISSVRVSCGRSYMDVSFDPEDTVDTEYEFDTNNGVLHLTEEQLNDEKLLDDLSKNDIACMEYAVLKLKTIND